MGAGSAVWARLADTLSGHDGAEGARWALRAPAPRALLRQHLAAMLAAGQPLGSVVHPPWSSLQGGVVGVRLPHEPSVPVG